MPDDACRTAFRLRAEGRPSEEIGQVLGIPDRTVRRLLERFRDCLQGCGSS
jgi:DNA-directed RNA polymerase specialized sigma24 family protein